MTKQITDQMGNTLSLASPPQRIVSLVPSQTELLYDLGLDAEVVGVTKFCIHPADKIANVTKVGGTKNFKFDVIDSLQPDLIIGNKEENYQEGIERLQERYPVWMSDIADLDDALGMIRGVGQVVDRQQEADGMAQQIASDFSTLEASAHHKRALYFIWQGPHMVAGKGTFIDVMMQKAGLINVIEKERYPELSEAEIKTLNPEVILLSSEPFPFKDKHVQQYQQLVPDASVHLVNGEMFSWYGSRLVKVIPYFQELQKIITSEV